MSTSIVVKHGVVFKEFNEYSIEFLIALKHACDKYGHSYVITSANDGHHSANSYHYRSVAWDIRLKDLPPAHWYVIQTELRSACGPYFDIIIENADDPDNVHLHCEADLEKAGDWFALDHAEGNE